MLPPYLISVRHTQTESEDIEEPEKFEIAYGFRIGLWRTVPVEVLPRLIPAAVPEFRSPHLCSAAEEEVRARR